MSNTPKKLLSVPVRIASSAKSAVSRPLSFSNSPLALAPADAPDNFEEMTLYEHLDELRSRVFKTCVAIALSFVIGLLLARPALNLILHQTHIAKFDINDATENITDYFKTALYIAVVIALPVIAFQGFSFIAPGLTNKEKRIVYSSIPFAILLFLMGASFAFFFAIPRAFRFLSTFMSSTFEFSPTFGSVAAFYMQVTLGLGLAFELPVVMFLLARIGIVSPQRMGKARRYAAVVVLIAAAIITPTPDPFNMMVVALPIYALYEIGLIGARIGYRRRERSAPEDFAV